MTCASLAININNLHCHKYSIGHWMWINASWLRLSSCKTYRKLHSLKRRTTKRQKHLGLIFKYRHQWRNEWRWVAKIEPGSQKILGEKQNGVMGFITVRKTWNKELKIPPNSVIPSQTFPYYSIISQWDIYRYLSVLETWLISTSSTGNAVHIQHT